MSLCYPGALILGNYHAFAGPVLPDASHLHGAVPEVGPSSSPQVSRPLIQHLTHCSSEHLTHCSSERDALTDQRDGSRRKPHLIPTGTFRAAQLAGDPRHQSVLHISVELTDAHDRRMLQINLSERVALFEGRAGGARHSKGTGQDSRAALLALRGLLSAIRF
jgi:hypothetical protein